MAARCTSGRPARTSQGGPLGLTRRDEDGVPDGALIAAILAGIAGVITAWAAVIRARKRGTKHCEEALAQARAEAEAAHDELHRLRMERGEVDWLMLISI